MSSTSGTSNNLNRITGTYSGLDTDKIISDLMKVERLKVDKQYRQRQLLEWKRDGYREITSSLMSFSDEYLNVAKTATNFRSPSSFAKFNINSSNQSVVTATANANAVSKTHSIKVSALASTAKIAGTAGITDHVKGSNVVSNFSLSGQQILVNLDGDVKSLTLDDYTDINGLEAGLEQKLTDAFGSGKFDVVTTDGKVELISKLSGSTFSLSGAGLTSLGFASGDNTTSSISLNSSLDSIKNSFTNNLNVTDSSANVIFTINGKTIDVGKSYAEASIKDVMDAINTSDAGVKMTYNSLNDQFSLEATTEGVTSNISYTDSASGLLKSLGIVDGSYTQGSDAEFTLDGVSGMKRSSNDFTVDGVTYSLKGISASAVSVEVNGDSDSIIANIKGFVEKYNALLDKINGKLSEENDRKYMPLTDAEKDAMTDEEVKKWEDRAKTGLLASDSILSKIVSSMRTALYEKIDGVSLSLHDIGISSSSYLDKGKLTIDETKLKKALTDNYDQVVKLFTNESDYTYRQVLDDPSKRSEKYSKSGLAQRLYDIIQDNVRTIRDPDGKKGTLLEKAGYTNDTTDSDNFLLDQIEDKNTLIDELEEKLIDKENWYYKKFANMESILGQMQKQIGSISAITGS